MIKNLILSGGAFKCCSHIGCIQYLEEQNALQYIDTFIGTSAGSLVCLCLCLGFSSIQIREAIKDFIVLQKDCPPDIDTVLNLYYTMGLLDGKIIFKFVERLLQKRAKVSNMSFLEFTKLTGKNFIVYSAKLPNLETTYFSVDTTPDLDIATAIRASCSLPIIFTPVKIGDNLYIDSGMVANFPHDYVKNNKLKDTLGIHIKSEMKTIMPDKLNVVTMMRMVLDSMMKKANESNGHIPKCMTHVEIVQPDCDGFEVNFDVTTCSFNISDEKINKYIEFGYTRIKQVFSALDTNLTQDAPAL